MAELWYMQENGRELGPMGFFFLKVMADERKIGPATLIRLEGGTWFPAGQLEGLFEGDGTPGPGSQPASPVPADPDHHLWSENDRTPRYASPHRQPAGGTFVGRVASGLLVLLVLGLVRAGCRKDRTAHDLQRFLDQQRLNQQQKKELELPPGFEVIKKRQEDRQFPQLIPVDDIKPDLDPDSRKALKELRKAQFEQLRRDLNEKLKKGGMEPLPDPPK